MKPAPLSLVAVLALSIFPFQAARAAAPACFRLPKETQSAGSKPRQSSSRRVTLASIIATDENCEYSLDPQGLWYSAKAVAAKGETDFASMALELRRLATESGRSTRPTTIFARRKNLPAGIAFARIESVFLAGCTEYMLGAGRAFNLSVPVETQQPSIERSGGADDCGASGLALHFAPFQEGVASSVLAKGPWPLTLAPDTPRITLEPGQWAIYAARAGSETGYLVGRISSGSSYTPLRAGLLALTGAKTPPAEPWLRASWAGGPLRFEPITDALRRGELWAELRTAAAADALWLAKGSEQGRAVLLGRLLLADNGDTVALPNDLIAEQMLERYGPSGACLAPTYEDWERLRADLQICLAQRYQASASGVYAGKIPEGATCAALASLTAPFSVQGGGQTPAGRVCVRRRANIMTAKGVKPGAKLDESCVYLPSGAAAATKPDFLIASTGDEFRYSGSGAALLYVCTDNDCGPLAAEKWTRFEKPGLVEIRRGANAEGARSTQGLTLLRLGVVDPATEWHPVGLYTGKGPAPANRWTALAHDEPEVFAYVRRVNRLDFHLSTSPTLTAAWNGRADLPSQMSEHIPVIGGVKGAFPGVKPATFVALVTRTAQPPKETAGEFREKPLVDPEKLLIDQTFYVHLAQYQGEDKPFRCIARAAFRVAERWSAPITSSIRVGLLGDTQAMVFIISKPALGLALPLVYGYWRLVYGLGVDVSLSLTAAGTLKDAELSRAGLGLSAAAVWGPEYDAPRLFSVGGMLHLATGTSDKQPLGSMIIGLNLATLFDLAGGR